MSVSHSISVGTRRIAERALIQRPHVRRDRRAVRVDEAGAARVEAGQMDLGDHGGGHRGQVGVGVDAVVARIDVDVVDVDQQSAAGSRRDGDDEFVLGNRRFGKREIAGDVLHQNFAAQVILDLADARADVVERFAGVGQRQQVVVVPAVHAAPAQMFGHARRLDAIGQALQLGEVSQVEWVGRPERQAHAVQRKRVVCAYPVERDQRRTAVAEVVFAMHFEPRHRRAFRQHVTDVRCAQSDAGGIGQHAIHAGEGRAADRHPGPGRASLTRDATISARLSCRPSSRRCPWRRTSIRPDRCRP